MYKIVALMGKAGAGKDTLLKECLSRNPNQLHEIISCTTRPPREGEIEGVNYYFLTEKEFLNKTMFESTNFRGWYYGISVDTLSSEIVNIGVFNPTGVRMLSEIPEVEIFPILVEVSDKERVLRQLHREINPDVKEIIRRYSADEIDFQNLDDINPAVVFNETFEDKQTAIDNIMYWAERLQRSN